MVFFSLIALVIGVLALKFLIPCPDPNPPLSLAGQLSNNLNLIFYLCCAVFSCIPAKSFQFWSFWLPIGFLLACVLVFNNAGNFAHAYFVAIHLAMVVMYTTIANVVVTTMSAGWGVRVLVAFLCGFVLPIFTLAQATGFSKSLC